MKKKIAVIFGGRSAEHDVSIITGHVPIIDSLLASGEYEVYPVYISKNGAWYSNPQMLKLDYFKNDNFEGNLANEKKLELAFDNGLTLIWPGLVKKYVRIDIVFPAMHGTYGEDGSLMGLLRMAGVPFVGCDLFASAVALDKVLTKQVVSASGLPIVPYVWFTADEWTKKREEIKAQIAKLRMPLFVKPVHLGSSIGITKVRDEVGLLNAIEVALHYDNKILVEEGVENLIEVTLPIIGNDELRLGAVERPLNKTEFFDFKDKYLAGGGKKQGGVNNAYSEIPANIDKELYAQVEEYGRRTYQVLGCSGIARVDFLIDANTKNIYVNEVNTLPGSLYHHNWKKIGVSGVELVTSLVNYALERHASSAEINFTFNSDILKQAGGAKTG